MYQFKYQPYTVNSVHFWYTGLYFKQFNRKPFNVLQVKRNTHMLNGFSRLRGNTLTRGYNPNLFSIE